MLLLDAVQLQFADEELTVTAPVPPLAVNVWEEEERVYAQEELLVVNVAVTFFAVDIVTLQVLPIVLSQPDQPVNVEPELAAAVSATLVPLL